MIHALPCTLCIFETEEPQKVMKEGGVAMPMCNCLFSNTKRMREGGGQMAGAKFIWQTMVGSK